MNSGYSTSPASTQAPPATQAPTVHRDRAAHRDQLWGLQVFMMFSGQARQCNPGGGGLHILVSLTITLPLDYSGTYMLGHLSSAAVFQGQSTWHLFPGPRFY